MCVWEMCGLGNVQVRNVWVGIYWMGVVQMGFLVGIILDKDIRIQESRSKHVDSINIYIWSHSSWNYFPVISWVLFRPWRRCFVAEDTSITQWWQQRCPHMIQRYGDFLIYRWKRNSQNKEGTKSATHWPIPVAFPVMVFFPLAPLDSAEVHIFKHFNGIIVITYYSLLFSFSYHSLFILIVGWTSGIICFRNHTKNNISNLNALSQL